LAGNTKRVSNATTKMSKEKSSEPRVERMEDQPVELKKGKKRKRAQPAKDGWSGKKGAGQLIKFDNSDDETPKPTPEKCHPTLS
jgi:ATP-dependent RNA helicase DHR2